MVKGLIRRVVWAGIDSRANAKVCVKRITNITAIAVVGALLLQVPVVHLLWQDNHQQMIVVILVHACLLCLVPLTNGIINFYSARSLLIVGFSSYLFLSFVLAPDNINTQYFFLLGIFICAFIFYPSENRQAFFTMGYFCCCFLATDLIHAPHLIGNGSEASSQQLVGYINNACLVISAFACALFVRANTNKSWLKINADNQISNSLLDKTLPNSIVTQLKNAETQLEAYHPSVSVLFADIKGFTELCQNRSAQSIVEFLNQFFSDFDDIVDCYGLEKIKTNGDQYMAVAGAPKFHQDHAINSCLCSIRMHARFTQLCSEQKLSLGLRIGIASGDAIAGIIGKHKYCYDVWGQTVNLAARLESNGVAGKVQVDNTTFLLAKQKLKFENRGMIEVKGMSDQATYWLVSST